MDPEKEAAVPEGLPFPGGSPQVHSPDKDVAPKGRPVSLKKIKESHVQQFYQQYVQEAAQKRQMAPSDFTLEFRKSLWGAAVKSANERINHIRKGLLRNTQPSQSPSKKPLVPTPEPTVNPIVLQQPLPTRPVSFDFDLKPELHSDNPSLARPKSDEMSIADLWAHKLTDEQLEHMKSFEPDSEMQELLLSDITPGSGDPFSDNSADGPGGRGSLFGARQANYDLPSAAPAGTYPIQDQTLPAQRPGSNPSGNFQQGTYVESPAGLKEPRMQNNNFDRANMDQQHTQDGNHATPQPGGIQSMLESQFMQPNLHSYSHTHGYHQMSPASNTMRSAAQTPSQTGGNGLASPQAQFDRAVLINDNLQAAPFTGFSQLPVDKNADGDLPADFNFSLPGTHRNPFETDGPPKSAVEAKQRFQVHIHQLNDLHRIRKENNDRFMFSYLEQGVWLYQAIYECLAITTGLRTLTDLLAKYDVAHDQRILYHMAVFIHGPLVPGLVKAGPRLATFVQDALKSVHDPEFRPVAFNKVTNLFYTTFLGAKARLMVIDSQRKDNPAHFTTLPPQTFKELLPITSGNMYAWLAPGADNELGIYDHVWPPTGPF
ncbi:uncharacterized protein HMPREF1541_08209 [Cyphellophora europaea CBS 101466]|uniref:Uncharacterized protein n=1 Tax=Cyphellophora europaea (strain CBS 101466) TaxID=1220924 RepID=W2RNA3_CYPE1|nr:uncharacterized protein HMPREF1541_08209 [Cyphellophora europaea CBS 101466]ETN37219.1 hypothetical protein HMPREF1541_08209 [Cyphellophora europaea CBS 101466]